MRPDNKGYAVNQESASNYTHHVDPDSTNANLITDIVSSLRELNDADEELTEILVEHLLTVSPQHDAVKIAADAIEQLAFERAKESSE